MFSVETYRERINKLKEYIERELRADLKPNIALTLGSGGAGNFTQELEIVKEFDYRELPNFLETTVEGHAGKLVIAKAQDAQVIIFSGRKHFYEMGFLGDIYTNLKEIVLPVYLSASLGCKLYIATNAAGGLNPNFKLGDIMQISSHLDLFFPNVLAGRQIGTKDTPRFQPQNGEYSFAQRQQIKELAATQGIAEFLQEGIYAAVTGPSFESQADSIALRKLGVDAVGMSTIPEVMTAANLGLDTLGFSLITNVINPDGTNPTSHEEVQSTLANPQIKQRFFGLLKSFLDNYSVDK